MTGANITRTSASSPARSASSWLPPRARTSRRANARARSHTPAMHSSAGSRTLNSVLAPHRDVDSQISQAVSPGWS
jgi:hypothetical protein